MEELSPVVKKEPQVTSQTEMSEPKCRFLNKRRARKLEKIRYARKLLRIMLKNTITSWCILWE